MLQTSLGPFNGATWEALCQLVFKRKYDSDGYQQIVASPGDFGLEGFALHKGLAFQCYCPDSHYGATELYKKQRDKITKDLNKLKKNEVEIAKRIGAMRIKEWHFVTPELDRNALLTHARSKELELRSWNSPILDDDFTIILRDSGYYIQEINEIRTFNGEEINFSGMNYRLEDLNGPPEEYESNVLRKTKLRLSGKISSPRFSELSAKLYGQTLTSFLEHGTYFQSIEKSAPLVYFKLMRVIFEYENSVDETCTVWTGDAESLISKIKDGLSERISLAMSGKLGVSEVEKITRLITSRWLAVCELDFD